MDMRSYLYAMSEIGKHRFNGAWRTFAIALGAHRNPYGCQRRPVMTKSWICSLRRACGSLFSHRTRRPVSGRLMKMNGLTETSKPSTPASHIAIHVATAPTDQLRCFSMTDQPRA